MVSDSLVILSVSLSSVSCPPANITGPIERALSRAQRSRDNNASANEPATSNSTSTQLSNNDRKDNQPQSLIISTPGTRPWILKSPRQVQKLFETFKETKWMIYCDIDHGDKFIISKCVNKFPSYFRGNRKLRLQKTSRWWRRRADTMKQKSDGKLVR